MTTLIGLIITALTVLYWLIIIEVILSWVPQLRYKWREGVRFLESITEPVLMPFRRLLPPYKTGGLDISPILAIIAIRIVQQVLVSVSRGLR